MDSPIEVDQSIPDEASSSHNLNLQPQVLPEIQNWNRQFHDGNSMLLTQQVWQSHSHINNEPPEVDEADEEAANNQTTRKEKSPLENDKKFFQAMLNELNDTEWMFASSM